MSRWYKISSKKGGLYLKGLIGLIQFFINLVIVFFLGYGLIGYISSIQTNFGKNLNNPKVLYGLVSKLSSQMRLLFAAGIAVAIIIYLIHTVFMKYIIKFLNKLV